MSEINYKKFKITNILEPHQGNAKYTKKAIISNGWSGSIPVISSDTSNNGILCYVDKKYVGDKDYIDFPCITWTVDGQAGTLQVRYTAFVPNNHCGYMKPIIDNLYLEYLVLAMQPAFYKCAKNSSNKKVGNNQIEKLYVNIPILKDGTPDLEKQKELAQIYNYINEQKQKLLERISELNNLSVRLPKSTEMQWAEVKPSQLFFPRGGNMNYSKTWCREHQGSIPIYSGTTTGKYDNIDVADYSGEYLSWCIDGLAGYVMYHNEKFSVTCHRGVLEPIVDMTNIDLKYIKYVIEPVFRKKKKGREGDLGKNEYTSLKPIAIKRMKETIPIPVKEDGTFDKKMQQELANKYEQIDEIKNSISSRILDLTEVTLS